MKVSILVPESISVFGEKGNLCRHRSGAYACKYLEPVGYWGTDGYHCKRFNRMPFITDDWEVIRCPQCIMAQHRAEATASREYRQKRYSH